MTKGASANSAVSFAGQMLEDLPPTQRQQLPQKLEDCQKRVVVLQRQLEAAQAELHRPQPAEDDATSVKVPTAALAEMRTKVALLEETEYQMSELEKLNAQLNQNILQLQQGKVRLLVGLVFKVLCVVSVWYLRCYVELFEKSEIIVLWKGNYELW